MGLDMGIGEQAELLQRTARDFFGRSYGLERARAAERAEPGFDRELWQQVRGLGWLTLGSDSPEPASALVEACTLAEEFGFARAVTPFKESVVAAKVAAAASTDGEVLIESIDQGRVVTVAAAAQCNGLIHGRLARPLSARRDGPSLLVSGTLNFVPFLGGCDVWLAWLSTEGDPGPVLAAIPGSAGGLSVRRLRTVSPVPQYQVLLEDVRVPVTSLVTCPPEAQSRMVSALAVATCAEMLGGCARVLDQTCNYAKDRVQFGQPIGSFQAMQNRFASLLIDLDVTRYVVYDAAWRVAAGEPVEAQLAYLGSWAGQAFERMCVEGHHINGAMSVTEEYGLEFLSRQALGTRLALGDPAEHKEQLLRTLEARQKEAATA